MLSLVGLAAYTVLGGADFGAGLWFLLSGRGDGSRPPSRAHVPCDGPRLGGEPRLAHLRPGGLLDGLPGGVRVDRLDASGPAVHRRGRASSCAEPRTRCGAGAPHDGRTARIGLVFSLSSVLTPFALGTAIGAIASGRVPVGNAEGDLFSSWLNPTSLLIGVLAVATAAYLAAVFLAADAARQDDEPLIAAFRRRALVAGVVAGAHRDRRSRGRPRGRERHCSTDSRRAPGSSRCSRPWPPGSRQLALVARSRFEPARYTAAVAVAAIVAGWGAAQSPTSSPG